MIAIDGHADGVHLADSHHIVAEAGLNYGHLKEIDETAVAEEVAESGAEVFNPKDGQLESEKVVEVRIRKNEISVNDITDAHLTEDNGADAQANDPESIQHEQYFTSCRS